MMKNTIQTSWLRHFFSLVTSVILIGCLPSPIYGTVEKVWDINLSEIFEQKTEGDFTPEFSPIYWNHKLLLCSDEGIIKSLDVATKKTSMIRGVPLAIEQMVDYGKGYFILYGEHKKKKKHYYFSVNLERKKVTGQLKLSTPIWKFDDWAMFEKHKQFLVFNPKIGQVVYWQAAGSSMKFPVHTPDDRNIFFNASQNLVELKLPELGAGLAFSRPADSKMVKDPKPILKFNVLETLEPDTLPDTLQGDILYYHRSNGAIGRQNVVTKEKIWERSYFKQNMSIVGPLEYKDLLYYLVSYPQDKPSDIKKGKIIALQRESGQAAWLSPDLYFSNFYPVRFHNSIVSGDVNGNLLFLDLDTGVVNETFNVGASLSKPIVVDKDMFIKTEDKIYYFKYKPPGILGFIKNLFNL